MSTLFDSSWILPYRTESLTSFFKIFPFFGGDSFYLMLIALCYWLSKRSYFREIGFLVLFSCLVNTLLKDIMTIPRPPSWMHLIAMQDNSPGFPSGDVQVATVFWGIMMIRYPNFLLRLLGVTMIVGISLSRVYLGVHSIFDVIGGGALGLLTLWWWQKPAIQSWFAPCFHQQTARLWGMIAAIVILYLLVPESHHAGRVMAITVGAIIGLGLTLMLPEQSGSLHTFPLVLRLFIAILSVSMVVLGGKGIPISESTSITFYLTYGLKYCFLIMLIYSFLPWLHQNLGKRIIKVDVLQRHP